MEEIVSTIGMENILLILVGAIILLLIIVLASLIKILKLNKRYQNFIKKIGNGENIEEDLENYMYRVERVEKQNAEISGAIKNLETDLKKCTQKVGLYRYNAFKDVGSDLSFTLALLDENNDGVVLNGIYSREMSNIYAKAVEHGNSKNTLSEEEQEAIRRAIASNEIRKIK